MSKVNVQDAKMHLSRYLKAVEAGEVVTICRRNVPIAELRPLPGLGGGPRRVGLARERFPDWELPDSFFEPLPDELVAAFEGEEA